jgi:hypothetical protein
MACAEETEDERIEYVLRIRKNGKANSIKDARRLTKPYMSLDDGEGLRAIGRDIDWDIFNRVTSAQILVLYIHKY